MSSEQQKSQGSTYLTVAILLFATVGFVCLNGKNLPVALAFDTSDLARKFTGLMAWLFALALFVERAVEVIIMVFRDAGADRLSQQEDELTREINTAKEVLNNPTAADTDKKVAKDSIKTSQDKLSEAEKSNLDYRAQTKKVALLISFVLGMLISFAGVRALSSFVAAPPVAGKLAANVQGAGANSVTQDPNAASWTVAPVGDTQTKSMILFQFLDILITGAMIAGGSEGVHRMANAFTSTMDNVSSQADKAQKALKAG